MRDSSRIFSSCGFELFEVLFFVSVFLMCLTLTNSFFHLYWLMTFPYFQLIFTCLVDGFWQPLSSLLTFHVLVKHCFHFYWLSANG